MKRKTAKKLWIISGSILMIAVIAFSISFAEFYKLEKKYNKLQSGMESRIVFFNIGNGDRLYLSQLIDSVATCDPHVIALDFFLEELKGPKVDSMLAKSISTSNSILGARHDGTRFRAVHPMFLASANKMGYAQSIADGGVITEFRPFIEYSGITSYHLAYQIALMFDKKKANQFLSDLNGRKPIGIEYRRLGNQFRKFDFENLSFDCAEIEGKIAYLGYLGPTSEDKHFTWARYFSSKIKRNEPDMYGPTIVANQVLMILDAENE